ACVDASACASWAIWCRAIGPLTCWGSRLGGGASSIIDSEVTRNPALEVGPAEVQLALSTVSQAIQPLRKGKHMTWILDSGFDDIAVWRTIWEDQDHVVSRVYHTDRLVEFQDRTGTWQQGDIAQACSHLRPVARAETSLEVQRGKQAHPKKQP